jgi:hypothetical protein
MRSSVVNISELRAEAADINWEFGQEPLPAKLIEHSENFLGFA